MKYNFTVIRSKRKSISLSVSPENEITVRCPYNFSESKINTFIESKSSWLDKIISENNVKLSENITILEYKEILVEGVKFPLIISGKNAITPDSVYVKNLDQIKKTFTSKFSKELIDKAQNISIRIGLHASGFAVKSYKRRWGCCDSKGRITFNYMLSMLPPELQRYVIIHELCHTVYFNHSSKFWSLVLKFEPKYKKLRKRLKSFDFITNLY